ncbi:metallophosphoesterase domain containing [Seminavis robusta]|uniref:Metallophosphoesterase domain containing n=1 Tax=Seminavis robusta TaxID=568900 RepID=A0A9N8HK96_9STRA|nr:metallophosphoesterase domain containing [Seminavis robusta]|eukprot:Sro601_g173580.1 metallophosphoesterase domain containing (308) ;mRNA; r:40860-41783
MALARGIPRNILSRSNTRSIFNGAPSNSRNRFSPTTNHPPLDNDVVRIVVISDTHQQHSLLKLPSHGVDVLIHCGDFTSYGNISGVRNFRRWLEQQTQFTDRIVVDGNHDQDRNNPDAIDLREEFSNISSSRSHEKVGSIKFLQDETALCANGRLRVHGYSWNSCKEDEFKGLPDEETPVDIVVAHVPGRLHQKHPQKRKKLHGSHNLAKFTLERRIPICCGGHYHWERGGVETTDVNDQGGTRLLTWFINAASKRSESSVHEPVVIDYNWRIRTVVNVEGLTQDNTMNIHFEEPFPSRIAKASFRD